jgi:hypothetical protein
VSEAVIWPFIGNRSDYPLVVAKTTGLDASAMSGIGTTCLLTTQPKTHPGTLTTTDPRTRERRCYRCHVWKHADDFYRDAADPRLQRMRLCKNCSNEEQRSRRTSVA